MRGLLRSAARLAERRPATPRPVAPAARPPDSAALMAALPVPVVLLDPANRLRFINHAAEQFLGVSSAAAGQLGLADFVAADNPLFLLVEQVRQHDAMVADHDLALEGPRLKRTSIAVQGAVGIEIVRYAAGQIREFRGAIGPLLHRYAAIGEIHGVLLRIA